MGSQGENADVHVTNTLCDTCCSQGCWEKNCSSSFYAPPQLLIQSAAYLHPPFPSPSLSLSLPFFLSPSLSLPPSSSHSLFCHLFHASYLYHCSAFFHSVGSFPQSLVIPLSAPLSCICLLVPPSFLSLDLLSVKFSICLILNLNPLFAIRYNRNKNNVTLHMF